MRSGPTNSHTIVRMLKSGTALTVLEQDKENGYSRVQTAAGTEGWVLSRYLIREPVARVQIENLVKQVTNTEPKDTSIRGQLNFVKAEFANANNRIDNLEHEKKELEKRLNAIKKTAADVLAIDAENEQLHQQYNEIKAQFMALQEQYSEVSNDNEREWFITGAMVLFGGLLLGLIIPKISWRKKRSPYGDF
ncbi:MAG: TIGR04211 family SH3 domain-containing protein [Nitrosomonas sp.]|nr:TIGR04211 family SH3 domain-containing protein [Nitrosomonas sp.]